jgi:cytochrome c2
MSFKIIALTSMVLLASVAHAEGDAKRGQKLYDECIACHAPERGAQQGVGPSLFGVIGRKAGDNNDFRFSPALKRSGIVWSERELDAYIADPQKKIPANRMPYSGMSDARDRADLLAYILVNFK